MKRVHKSSRAILVLESPWSLDITDSNRTSALPFVEGIAKLAGDVEVYHANFYDKSSLEKALNFFVPLGMTILWLILLLTEKTGKSVVWMLAIFYLLWANTHRPAILPE